MADTYISICHKIVFKMVDVEKPLSYINRINRMYDISQKGELYIVYRFKVWSVFYDHFYKNEKGDIEYKFYIAMLSYLNANENSVLVFATSSHEVTDILNKVTIKTKQKTVSDDIVENKHKKEIVEFKNYLTDMM